MMGDSAEPRLSPSPMRYRLLLAAIVLLVFVGSFLARGILNPPAIDNRTPPSSAKRIVSVAPSITEILFRLGLGDRVVGRTKFCKFPPEAQSLPHVGGHLDLNIEALVVLKPDLVITLQENAELRKSLRELSIDSLTVSHQTIDGILDSIDQLGRQFGAEKKARRVLADIRSRIRAVEEKTAGRDRPRVMVAVYRSAGSGKLEDVNAAGADGYYDEMIAMAGGQNVCRQGTVRFPIISNEGILWMNPDVIIDIVPPPDKGKLDRQTILADWQQVAEVAAVRHGRVHVLDNDFAYIPGPRFVELVERMARLLHPEVSWPEGDSE